MRYLKRNVKKRKNYAKHDLNVKKKMTMWKLTHWMMRIF